MSVNQIDNNRQNIEYHHRKFKLNLSGRSTDGQYVFQLNPPNETANSNNYNQCLFKISRVFVSNQINTAAFGANNLGAGFSDIWEDGAGGVVNQQGILITTNVASMNNHHLNDVGGETKAGCSVLIPNECAGGSFPFATGGAIDGLIGQGMLGITRSQGGAVDSRQNACRGMIWKYQDDRPIESGGVLCGNPFGKQLIVETRSPHDGNVGAAGTRIRLTDIGVGAGAINNTIGLEIEVLMLPNATPMDRK
jgi:hypothetical protein